MKNRYEQISQTTCMKSIYNSVEYSIRRLDKNYYFIIIYFSIYETSAYINNLRGYEYIPVYCANQYFFGVWIFTHGNFVIQSNKMSKDFVRYSSSDENTFITYNDNNIILSFNYVKNARRFELPAVYEISYRLYSPNLYLDNERCIRSLYNDLQHLENDDKYKNNAKEKKFIIVLNLQDDDNYKNDLTNYYYKSVECGNTIFDVWISSCGQFTIKSKTIYYSGKYCNINDEDVRNKIMDFYGRFIYTLNENTNTYVENNSSIIINFNDKNCYNPFMTDDLNIKNCK